MWQPWWTKARRLLFEEVPGQEKGWKKSLIKTARVTYYAVKDFNDDDLLVKASALTYFTLLSIVPLLAMAFGIAQGFGLEAYLEKIILENFESQQQIMEQLLNFSHSMLQNTQGGLVAGVGAFLLLWTVMRLLTNIESSFNSIWNVKKSRTLVRKFTDYIAMMILAPIFIIISSSATVYAEVYISELGSEYALLGWLGSLYSFLLGLLPYVSTWMLFTLLFLVMPNTRVQPKYALLAGVLMGSVYQVVQYGYIYFQVNVSKFNAVYGSFAALPLFLIWLQLSWLIILIGAEIAYYSQHVDQFDSREKTRTISPYHQKLLSLIILRRIVAQFHDAAPALDLRSLSAELGVPINVLKDLVAAMVQVGLLSEVYQEGKETALQPAKHTALLSISHVMETLDMVNHDPSLEAQVNGLEDMKAKLLQVQEEIKLGHGKLLLSELT
jgi:membrane protein